MQDTIFEVTLDLLQTMRRQLTDITVVTVFRMIISIYRYNLVILFTLKTYSQ
jgi:hypothetical protein